MKSIKWFDVNDIKYATYAADPFGVCAATSKVIEYDRIEFDIENDLETCEHSSVEVSTTLLRTVSYFPEYHGKCYEISCPELGKFECVYMSEHEFNDQFAMVGLLGVDFDFRTNHASDRAKREKHFRLSTHRGGKHRAEHADKDDNDDSSE